MQAFELPEGTPPFMAEAYFSALSAATDNAAMVSAFCKTHGIDPARPQLKGLSDPELGKLFIAWFNDNVWGNPCEEVSR